MRDRHSPKRLEAFEGFLQSVRRPIRLRAEGLYPAVRRLQQNLLGDTPGFDLFHVLGIAGKENRYTDALAWLLKTDGVGPSLAGALKDPVFPAPSPSVPAGKLERVTREVVTRDGRVDLVLEYEHAAIAIEVKIWSFEHDTPGAVPQTMAYAQALEERLVARGRPKPARCVLLTPDGRAPANPEAGRLSFVRLGSMILDRCIGKQATAELIVARMVGLHFIEIGALSRGGSLSKMLKSPLPEKPDEPWLQKHISDLLAIADLAATSRR
jgi:hypothetical protein